MRCLSHPNKFLIEHLQNVENIGIETFREKNTNFYIPIENIESALRIALFYHDFAKSTQFFQEYLLASINKERLYGKSELTQHALLSALYASYLTHLEVKENKLSLAVFLAIKKHHNNLKNINDMLSISSSQFGMLQKQWENIIWDDFEKVNKKTNISFNGLKSFFWNDLSEMAYQIDLNNKKINESDPSFELYYLINLFFSILVYADKTDVILGKRFEADNFNIPISRLIGEYKNKNLQNLPTSDLNKIRNSAYIDIEQSMIKSLNNNNIFSINLPTGFGKTLISINCATYICEKTQSRRIIYALPFTAIADQTADTVRKVFETSNIDPKEFLTVHHHLAEISINTDENSFEADKAQFLIENWEKPFIVTTFWQLFNALISGDNALLRKFHNLSNSVIILDEVQTLPYRYWNLIENLLKNLLIKYLNCKIIILTATMPMIFSKNSNSITSLVDIEKRKLYFSKFNRYIIKKINKLQQINQKELLERALKHLKDQPSKSFMFVFNTIKSSQEFYNLLIKHIKPDEIYYLSSRVLPIDRNEVIINIIKNSNKKILVSTQVIEAGMDIDFDIVYRDFAPLDNIVQTAGRCNRNNNDSGEVHLFNLVNEKGKSYHTFIYKGLTLDITEKIFSEVETLEEKDLLDFIDKFYSQLEQRYSTQDSSKIIKNICLLEYESMTNDFKLIDEQATHLLFIEKDEIASQLLAKFKQIRENSDIFQRKKEFLEIKSKFFQYVISLPKFDISTERELSSFKDIGNFKILEKELVKLFYDGKMGFHMGLDSQFM